MKLKKFFAGAAAAAVAISALAIPTSAKNIYSGDQDKFDEGLIVAEAHDQWLLQLYNVGSESEKKPARDYGITPHDVARMVFYLELVPNPDEPGFTLEDFDPGIDGGMGGAVIFSANGGGLGTISESDMFDPDTNKTYYDKYNWPSTLEWWGFPTETDSPDNPEKTGTIDYDKKTHLEYLNLGSFKLDAPIPDEMRWPADEDRQGECYQIGLQEWGSAPTTFWLRINMLAIYNDKDELLIAFDEFGKQVENAEATKRMTDYETPKANTTPSTEATGDSTAASTEGSSASTTAGSSAPTTTVATTAASSSSNTGLPVGVIIGIIAAVVVVIVVVVIIVIKKKKN